MEITEWGIFDRIDAELQPEDFKQSWTHIESAGVKAILSEHVEENMFGVTDSDADIFFGLAYTSGSKYAGEWATSNITIDGLQLRVFLIRGESQIVAMCEDVNENEYFYEVE